MQVIGTNTNGDAVRGTSDDGGAGVRGIAKGNNHDGVVGQSKASGNGVLGTAADGDGVRGDSAEGGAGVRGTAKGKNHDGVVGQSTGTGNGVLGVAADGDGVRGDSTKGGAGVRGTAKGKNHVGVVGQSTASGNGVLGVAANGDGVRGDSTDGGAGVRGTATGKNHIGVVGQSNTSGSGVFGIAASGDGVHGESTDGGAGVRGISHNRAHIGVVGENTAAGLAGGFFGNVEITGNLTMSGGDIFLTNADFAEEFSIAGDETIELGTVVVIDDAGTLRPSGEPYDKRVAGVLSGAGEYKPGITLDRQPAQANRLPVALLGKVCCKVDAQYSRIDVGDLLTTSATPGHAMRATDPSRAFGAVIGKALRPLAEGTGLIPILVALR